MDLTVMICTRDRAPQLTEVLTSFTKVILPSDLKWELIVVDNGSSDTTADVVESFSTALPIKRLFQPVPGKSNALNMGIQFSLGSYILHTDDDVRVDKDWIAAYGRAFRRWPEATVFGGRSAPILLPPTPDWFAQSLEDMNGLLGVRDFGPDPVPLSLEKGVLTFGLNMALRSDIQRKFLYNANLGVAPGRRMGGEETDVVKRALEAGHSGWWIPDAFVYHIIPPSRQSEEYIERYYRATGELTVHQAIIDKNIPRLIFGVPTLLWIKLPLNWLKFFVAKALKMNSKVRFLTYFSYRKGEFVSWRAFSLTKEI